MALFITIFSIVILIALIVWAIYVSLKQSEDDWATFNNIKKMSQKVSSKEEIEVLHRELVEFGRVVQNGYIHKELQIVESYLMGLYKQFKQ